MQGGRAGIVRPRPPGARVGIGAVRLGFASSTAESKGAPSRKGHRVERGAEEAYEDFTLKHPSGRVVPSSGRPSTVALHWTEVTATVAPIIGPACFAVGNTGGGAVGTPWKCRHPGP